MTEKKASQGNKSKKKKESDALTPEIIESKIPDELQGEFEKLGIKSGETAKIMAVMMRYSSSYQGPLPPAKEFETYEKACPGAGKRILKYMENEQKTRHDLDSTAIHAAINDTKRGQFFGFLVMAGLILLAAFVAYLGNVWLAGAITLFSAGSAVANKFIDGRSHEEKPSKEKKS